MSKHCPSHTQCKPVNHKLFRHPYLETHVIPTRTLFKVKRLAFVLFAKSSNCKLDKSYITKGPNIYLAFLRFGNPSVGGVHLGKIVFLIHVTCSDILLHEETETRHQQHLQVPVVELTNNLRPLISPSDWLHSLLSQPSIYDVHDSSLVSERGVGI